jgi:hypothetical protein
MELVQGSTDGANDKSTLFLLSGEALVVFGAGLIVSNPFIRKHMSQLGVGSLAQAAMPNIERYFRLRAM